ncbi:MAG: Ppx/GppA family phosphatase [Oscillospiraceae bacterium]|jgi:exopolyphosphatase/guanosine-5'-triphosphate,3'-diphosphate pyrophosphatase|nr:Ppx/GppA family phosphatase [Oscillospiraceae bacterium]
MDKRVAVIDLGSNSARLTIWNINERGGFSVIERAKETVRLSEGLVESGVLKPEPMERAFETIRVFARLIKNKQADLVWPVATEALRRASNASVFTSRIKAETGLEFNIISGGEEAEYDFRGVVNSIYVSDCLIADVGGASTELVLIKNREVKRRVSLPFGAVTLTEEFWPENKNTESAELDKFRIGLLAYVRGRLGELGWLDEARGLPLVALGGSMRALGRLSQKLKNYPLELLHGYSLKAREVRDLINMLLDLPLKKRAELPSVDKKRAEILPGGLAPLFALMEKFGLDSFIASEASLREGVFFSHYLSGNPIVGDVVDFSARNLIRVYGQDEAHSEHVLRISAALYQQLAPLHKADGYYLRPLKAAAMLHDIGQLINYEEHEKHGFYLTLNAGLNGLSHRELVLAAMLVGMHRIKDLKIDPKAYNNILQEGDFENIKKLSLILKLAEKLDRNSTGAVRDLKCFIRESELEIRLIAGKGAEAIVSAAMTSEKSFEKIYGRKLIVSC